MRRYAGIWSLVTVAGATDSLDPMSQTATPGDTRRLLSPAEVAALANVSRKTIYHEIDRGSLRVLHVGRQLRIDPADLAGYLDREEAS